MTAAQLVLDLPHRPALGREAFFVAPANEAALAFIERWPHWPHGAAVLVGPPGAGKTHLIAVFRQISGAGPRDLDAGAPPDADGAPMVIDDADARLAAGGAVAEEALFHLLNRIWNRPGRLLMAARRPPGRWPIGLPDLASRLKALPVIEILPPDDSLLAAVMVKQLADRQLAITPAVAGYVLDRIPRSFAAVAAVVAALDRQALAERRRITIPLARRVLAALEKEG